MNSLTVRIVHDSAPESPRTWDHLGIIAGFHPRYTIGDRDPGGLLDGGTISPDDYNGWDEMRTDLLRRDAVWVKPIYLYDHGGLSISTRSFVGRAQHGSWDSGQVGFTFTTRERMKEFLSKTRLTNKTRETVDRLLEAGVEEYNQFMTGDVYAYLIEDEAGNVVDTCGGYYGLDVVREEAADQIAWFVKNELNVSYD